MNDQTLQALQALAAKLGTTVEMLWGVLLRQAVIEAVSAVVWISIFAGLSVIALLFVVKKTRTPESDYGRADWAEEAAFFAWAAWVVFTIIGAFVVAEGVSQLLTVLFNPEYWALKQVLAVLK